MSAVTTPAAIRPKRAYSRPSAATWQEITELFQSGALSLAELARRYGVSTRAIQMHVAAARPAPTPSLPVPPMPTLARSAGKLTEAAHSALIEETRTSAYDDATALQALIARAVGALAADTSTPMTAVIRACDMAAVALARVHNVRRLILAMGKGDGASDAPLPELPIRVLTEAETTAIRDRQAREDAEYEVDAYQLDKAEGDDDGVEDEDG